MRKYKYDPRLFDDCDPFRIPYGEDGYDPFYDRPLPRLTVRAALDPNTLYLREAILNARAQRFHYEQRHEAVRSDAVRLKAVLSR